jgi:lipoprotein-anchoring transpeptidase ErfK/SrfK
MFADESFAADLKSKLQLTDEQIDKLKTVSRQAVSNLREDESDTQVGSTRASIERADKQIREMLGEEKANKLFELVSQRWGGEDVGNSADNAQGNGSKPNSVPTDSRVVVNAPAYRMDVFQEGKLVKTYKIGIGYPEFPLPTGTRKAKEIIFNPTWTPPDEPWVESSGKVKVGEKVAAGDKLNPLGPIKIPIGSPSLIHGGKSPARLGTFASHGCVGLTNQQVQDFALDIANISGTTLTKEDVKGYEKTKTETKNVNLGKTISVELRYETIVVEDGKLKIFRDVYEKGTNTEESLRRVLDSYGVSFDSLSQPERDKILAGLKQMAMDAQGSPVDVNGSQNQNGNVNKNVDTDKNIADSKSKNTNSASENGSVTRTIKGKKEVVFELAQLKGKGYPAPVGMAQK